MDGNKGTEFSLWNGEIYGKNIEVIPDHLLKQEWYENGWEKPSYATFTLTQHGNTTEIVLEHTDIPDASFPDIQSGWDTEYLGSLKKYLET